MAGIPHYVDRYENFFSPKMIHFCYDDMGEYGLGYPNLARNDVQPWEFDHVWPRTVPLRLLLYLQAQSIAYEAHLVKDAPLGSWYPIAMAWHDFECDYIGLLQDNTRHRLKNREIRLLFYYHEGDNPSKICQHIQKRCLIHHVPSDCFLLVSANSAADGLELACYFPDHEYFFRWLNRSQSPIIPSMADRPYQFTALNRLHKSWRAHVMADLVQQGILSRSLWSYNTQVIMDHADTDNPLDVSLVENWTDITNRFLVAGPYFCDSADDQAHNDHTHVNTTLYYDSSCHLVLETLLDADGSGGTFLTEKTYKCIKYGQPFVIMGTPGSLTQLKRDGYRTFDHVIDPSYDHISDPTQRYLCIRQILRRLSQIEPYELLSACHSDLVHNQRIFLDLRSQGLNRLVERLQ